MRAQHTIICSRALAAHQIRSISASMRPVFIVMLRAEALCVCVCVGAGRADLPQRAPMMTMVDDDGVPQQTIEYRTPHCVGVDQINHFCGCLCVCVCVVLGSVTMCTRTSRDRVGVGFSFFCVLPLFGCWLLAAAAVVAVFCESNSRARGWQVTMHFVCCVCSGIARARAYQPG